MTPPDPIARLRTAAVLAAVAALALLVGLALAPSAEARAIPLSKIEARSNAEEEALDLFLYNTWASDYEISSCKRASRAKARCRGLIAGVELEDCSAVTFKCTYFARQCTFDVVVKRAGLGVLTRARNLRCSASRFSD